MPEDRIQKLRNSVIQHGKSSDRIYLMKMQDKDMPALVSDLDHLAGKENYSKIFAKVPSHCSAAFMKDGYIPEARVPGFYGGKEEGVFLAKYFSEERLKNPNADLVDDVLKACEGRAGRGPDAVKKDGFSFRKAGPADIPDIALIYEKVFESYPFPIHEAAYLLETMKSHVKYFVAFDGDGIAAVSSSEMDKDAGNAEMTDFATLPEYRGQGLAARLLAFMERQMASEGVKTLYTIARAVSYGMNICFAINGYAYAGTLVNNTNIAGSIESMNVWYKGCGDAA